MKSGWAGREVTRGIHFKGAEEVDRLLKDRKWEARTSKGFRKDCGACCQVASVISLLCACPWHSHPMLSHLEDKGVPAGRRLYPQGDRVYVLT